MYYETYYFQIDKYIFYFTVCGELDVLDILYGAGADLNTFDIHGAYPIHYAAQMCSTNSEMGVDSRIGLNGMLCILFPKRIMLNLSYMRL